MIELKPNKGIAFQNTKKQDNPNQPDYRGEVDIDGKRKEIAIWFKKSEKGTNMMSISISEPYVKPTSNQTGNGMKPNSNFSTSSSDDDLPF